MTENDTKPLERALAGATLFDDLGGSGRVEPHGQLEHDVLPGVGAVESWYDLVAVRGPLVTFRGTCVFASDGAVLTSESTLRFRDREEVQAQLEEHGYDVVDVRGAPDRPGRELVFIAQRVPR